MEWLHFGQSQVNYTVGISGDLIRVPLNEAILHVDLEFTVDSQVQGLKLAGAAESSLRLGQSSSQFDQC